MCKHTKKVRSSQAAILVLNWVKENFPLWLLLRRKADRNFPSNLLKNHFRHPNFYWNSPSWLTEVFVIWEPIESQKAEVHIFERANHSGFAKWEFAVKEDLNPRKQVFLLNLKLYPAHKPKSWFIFYEKISASQILSHLLWPSSWHVTSEA